MIKNTPLLALLQERLRDFTPANIIEKIDAYTSFVESIPITLHKAILTGEYYASNEILVEISTGLTKLQPPEGSNDDLYLIYKQTEAFFRYFAELSSKVQSNVRDLMAGNDGNIYDLRSFSSYMTFKDLSLFMKFEDIELNEIIYRINILLAYIDEQLECSIELKSELKSIYNFLKENEDNGNVNTSDFIKILKSKADFLLHKIDYRIYLSAKKNDELFRNKPKLLEVDNAYIKMQEKIEYHYSNFEAEEYNRELKVIEKLNANDANVKGLWKIEPFHHMNRLVNNKDNGQYFKILKDRSAAADKLQKRLAEALEVVSDECDKISFQGAFNLLKNAQQNVELEIEKAGTYKTIITQLSGILKEKSEINVSIDFITEKIKDTENFSGNGSVPNYYCYMQLIKFMHSLLDSLIKIPENLITEEIREIREDRIHNRFDNIILGIETQYNKIHNLLIQVFEKMGSHKLQPVYLRLEERTTEYTLVHTASNQGSDESDKPVDEKYKLFLASSYILPINFRETRNKVNALKNIFSFKLQQVRESIEIRYGRETIQKSIDDFEKKAKENEFKIVQIIAMFVSIATFVLINVKIFDNKTGLESFGIILGLAACFFIFNLMFYIVVAFRFESKKGKWYIGLGWLLTPFIAAALCAYGSYSILKSEENKTTPNIIKMTEQLHEDSVNLHKILDNPALFQRPDTLIKGDTIYIKMKKK